MSNFNRYRWFVLPCLFVVCVLLVGASSSITNKKTSTKENKIVLSSNELPETIKNENTHDIIKKDLEEITKIKYKQYGYGDTGKVKFVVQPPVSAAISPNSNSETLPENKMNENIVDNVTASVASNENNSNLNVVNPLLPTIDSVLYNSQIVAFYGKPGSKRMGILGEYSKESLAPILESYAKLYDDVNGDLNVKPAFYIIYGTVWPEGEIGILSKSVTEEYIEFALEKNWIVILDHQLGKYSVKDSVTKMLPYLKYPNVHLAIDPEWHTTIPMKEIGYVTGEEVNTAQKLIDDYITENNIPGKRMLILHQFRPSMIRNSSVVKTNYKNVDLIHTADGFGSPELKKNTYKFNSSLKNFPIKGFKLFFESKVVGAGWDKPLMTPMDVMNLDPVPLVVMYQ